MIISPHAEGSRTSCEQNILVATTEVPPLIQMGKGYITGIFGDRLVRDLDQRELDYTIQIYPWARALNLAQMGKVDALFPTLFSEQRGEFLDYSLDPTGEVTLALFATRERVEELNEVGKQHFVVTMRSLEYKKELLNGARVVETADFESGLIMLEGGRVDYLLGLQRLVEYALNRTPKSNIKLAQVLDKKPGFLALAKNSPNYEQVKSCLVHHPRAADNIE